MASGDGGSGDGDAGVHSILERIDNVAVFRRDERNQRLTTMRDNRLEKANEQPRKAAGGRF